jgi:hypothetical protein
LLVLAREDFIGILRKQKRRNYESAKSRVRFDGNDVFVRRQIVCATGKDRL